jgi:cell wall-associated NlpC family hydrolase
MKYARVTTNVLDLWAEPRYNSERSSQVLYGDVVSLGKEQQGFVQVKESDGYSGWLDVRFLTPCPKPSPVPPRGWKRAIVNSPTAWINPVEGQSIPAPFFFFYGTRLLTRRAKPGILSVCLPDGTVFPFSERAVRELSPTRSKPRPQEIIREARKHLGVPYLWGGITPFGFDCSGLVRMVFRQFGIELPRDTKDQIRVGREVRREEVKPGDLLFFNRHVGIAMRLGRIIHASVGGGGVRINSLRADTPDYRPDLDRDFKLARRLL